MADSSKLVFDSSLNYLKKDDDLSGEETLTLTSGVNGTLTITHDLGYIPFVTVASELKEEGIIWSTTTARRNINAGAILSSPSFEYTVTETTLDITIRNNNVNDRITGDRTVYYNIYLDYENA